MTDHIYELENRFPAIREDGKIRVEMVVEDNCPVSEFIQRLAKAESRVTEASVGLNLEIEYDCASGSIIVEGYRPATRAEREKAEQQAANWAARQRHERGFVPPFPDA